MNMATIVVSGVYAHARMYSTIPAGIVGATVTFEFIDPIWEGLTKTAVFQGAETRDVILTGNTAVIPAETVAKAGPMLKVGIYGVDAENNLVIPTLWAAIGGIRDAADPSGDPGTDPELPIWAQLADRVEGVAKDVAELQQTGGVGPGTPGKPGADGEDGGYYTPAVTQLDEDTIQFDFTGSKADMPAVAPVTVELPVGQGSGGNVAYDEAQELTEEQKAQARENIGAQPKGNYLESAALPEAINTALSQAKDTGMFDGKDGIDGKDGADGQPGKDGQDYVLTDADRNEIAEMAADLVEVPESSGGGIAVTGAKVGQTVKISAVDENGVPTAWESVDFPSGGSGGGVASREVLAEGTLDYSTSGTRVLPISLSTLREYKMFVISVEAPVSCNYALDFGKQSDYKGYRWYSIKSLTVLVEWLDDKKTMARIVARNSFTSDIKSDPNGMKINLDASIRMPVCFPSIDEGDEIYLGLSVAQTSDVKFKVYGVLK